MSGQAAALSSGKGHRDENFPVASVLISPRHRPAILAFYNFVRAADDVSDHATAAREVKLRLLEEMRASLMGASDVSPQGVTLRKVLAERSLSNEHAADLLEAFRRDVTKLRYENWNELVDYCRFSAMPVGRYVLEVHGEAKSTWSYSDVLCTALQIINHLQDCQQDYQRLDRVYVPLDALTAYGTSVEAIGAREASPALRACLRHLAERTSALLREGAVLPSQIRDLRLSLEISVIHRLAERLVEILMQRDPLSERVHLSKPTFAGIGLIAVITGLARRMMRRPATMAEHQDA